MQRIVFVVASLAAWQVLIANTDSVTTHVYFGHTYKHDLNGYKHTPAVLWTSTFTEHDSKFACAHVPTPRLLQDMLLKQSHTITAVRLHHMANAKSNVPIWFTKSLTRQEVIQRCYAYHNHIHLCCDTLHRAYPRDTPKHLNAQITRGTHGQSETQRHTTH
jgi:hypothetical protein